MWALGMSPGPLQEQLMLITTESSLQLLLNFIFNHVYGCVCVCVVGDIAACVFGVYPGL